MPGTQGKKGFEISGLAGQPVFTEISCQVLTWAWSASPYNSSCQLDFTIVSKSVTEICTNCGDYQKVNNQAFVRVTFAFAGVSGCDILHHKKSFLKFAVDSLYFRFIYFHFFESLEEQSLRFCQGLPLWTDFQPRLHVSSSWTHLSNSFIVTKIRFIF